MPFNIFSRIDFKYVIFIFVFVLICLEVFGRIYLVHVLKKSTKPKFQFDSYRIYSHIPHFTEGDGKKNWIEINGQGFRRSEEVIKVKPKNTYRVFLLGGSAAHGISTAPPYPLVHIYMDETIDFYLEKLIREKHPDINTEIINAAVTGYQVFQHTSYLLSELLDYNPDLIIFVDGANDHYMNNPDYNYMADNPYQFWKPRLRESSLTGFIDYTALWFSNFSGFARGFYSWRLNKDAANMQVYSNVNYSTREELISAYQTVSLRGYLRSVEANIQLLKINGVDAIITLQPMLVLRHRELLSENEKSFLHRDENVKTLYPFVVNDLLQLTEKYNIPFIDLNLAFNDEKHKGKQLLVDYCHFSPEGGNVVANELLPVTDSLLQNKIKSFTYNKYQSWNFYRTSGIF